MTVLGSLPGGFLLSEESVAGPNPYDEGNRPTITFTDFAQSIERIVSVRMDNGHEAQEFSVAGRVLTVRVFGQANTPGADGVPQREVQNADNEDMSSATISAVAVGR